MFSILFAHRLLISGVGEVLVQQLHDCLAEGAGQVIAWWGCLAGGEREEESRRRRQCGLGSLLEWG